MAVKSAQRFYYSDKAWIDIALLNQGMNARSSGFGQAP